MGVDTADKAQLLLSTLCRNNTNSDDKSGVYYFLRVISLVSYSNNQSSPPNLLSGLHTRLLYKGDFSFYLQNIKKIL